jgi:hypothetical protein
MPLFPEMSPPVFRPAERLRVQPPAAAFGGRSADAVLGTLTVVICRPRFSPLGGITPKRHKVGAATRNYVEDASCHNPVAKCYEQEHGKSE